MTFLLLDAMRNYLAEALASLPLYTPPVRGRAARLEPPRVLIGELPPGNSEPAADVGGYPFVLLHAVAGEDTENGATCTVTLECAVAAAERGEAVEHEILNLLGAVRTALLTKRNLAGKAMLSADPQGRLLKWLVYPESAHPYVAGQIQGIWTLPGIQLTEEIYNV